MSSFEIPGYSIIRPLDSGGMATVYLAEQTSLGREVAIKVMSEHLSKDPTFAERFSQEAKIASHLSHPNIVTIFDYGSINSNANGSTLYLVMAFVEGEDLKSLQPKLSLVTRLKIIQDIAQALHYAHDQGVIHRDIKPQNILVERKGSRAQLTDFGIAKARQNNAELTQTGMTLGTPHYMAPEQALGKPVDHRADIYSLGVVLYFLLTGSVPYDGESEVAIGIKHFKDPIPRLPEIFNCFQTVLDKALAKDPDDRYQTAGEFAEAVGQVSIGNLATLVQSLNDKSEAQTKISPTITPEQVQNSGQKNKYGFVTGVLIAFAIAGIVMSLILKYPFSDDSTNATPPFRVVQPPTPIETSHQNVANPVDGEFSQAANSGAPTQGSDKLQCSYTVVNDWGHGWQAEIVLSNQTGQDIQDWEITFSLPIGTTLTNSFVTKKSQDGRRVQLSPHDWNRTIKSGETLQLGFQGDGQSATALNDLDCQ